MEPDYIDVRLQQRRQIFFGAIIALVIGASVAYYFWGNLINKGTLLVYSEAPFTVSFYEEKDDYKCDKSPCEIVKKIGERSFLVEKDGYKTEFASADIKLWRTVEKIINLKMIPRFTKVDGVFEEEKTEYFFVTDPINQMQKIVKVGDEKQSAIVYFPKSLKTPVAFGNGKTALVVDKDDSTAYKIDVRKKTKQSIENIPQIKNIVSGKWSNDGKFFVMSFLRQPNLWLMDEKGGVDQLDIKAQANMVAWDKNNRIIFIFGSGLSAYDPVTQKVEQIDLDGGIPEDLESLISTNSGEEIYAKSGEIFYKLVLE